MTKSTSQPPAKANKVIPPRPQRLDFDSLSDHALIRLRDLVPHVVAIGPATAWRLVALGQFPAPIKVSPGVTAWRVAEVRAWLAAKAKEGAAA